VTYPPIAISWSSLRTHEECRQKAKLVRERKGNPSQNIRNFFHGNVVDRVMREWLDGDPPVPGTMSSFVARVMEEEEQRALDRKSGIVKWRDANDREEVLAFCQRLVVKLEPILERLVLPYDYDMGIRFKVPMLIPDPDGGKSHILLTGEMDLLVRQAVDQWAVWDLKATANNDYWRKTVAQLTFYDIAVRAMYGKFPVEAGLIQPMCDQQVLPVSISGQDRVDLMSRIVLMAHDMWLDFAPIKDDGSNCSYCHVRHACERYKPTSPNRVSFVSVAKKSREVNSEHRRES